MTAGPDELFVQVGGRDVGLQQILQRVDAEMQQSADQAVRLGQQYARLAQAQGQPTLAGQVLASTMQRAGGASEQSLIGISTQAARLTNTSQGLSSTIQQLGGQMGQLGGTAGALASSIGGLAGSMGTLGVAGAAIGIGKVGFELAQTGAQAEQTGARFEQLARQAGTSGDAMLAALRQASGGTISDTALQLDAMKASLLGVAGSADQLGPLLAIARDRAQQMGISVEFAFESLVTGLGRGSRLILDNIGVIVKESEVNERYAASVGKTVAQLTDQEKKQALINEVLRQGNETIRQTGGAIEGTATQIQQGQAAFENLKASVGELAAIRLGPLAADVGAVVNALTGRGDIGAALGKGLDLGSRVNPQIDLLRNMASAADSVGASLSRLAGITVPDNFSPLRDSIRQWLELLRLAPAAEAQAASATAVSADTMESARERERAATNAARDGMEVYRAAELQAAAVAQQAQAASLGYANALELTGVQARAAALAAQQKANADQVAAVDAQTHAVAQQQLAQQAQQAAQALLAAGGAGANTAAALATSSSQVDVLTAAYYRLAAAQQAAGAAAQKAVARKEDFAERHGGEAGADLTPAARARAAQQQLVNQQIADAQKASAAQDALNRQIEGTGTATQKVTLAQQQYNEAVKRYGAGSAQAIDAQTKLIQAQQAGAKGGRGGAARLSDQQKLENSLLANQDQYQDRSEDAEAQHQQRLLDIQQDYMERMRKAQQAFQLDQADSRAGFYDNLGKIENAGLQKSLSAEYEQAFADADRIAKERGADVADNFLKAKQAAIEAQAGRAAAIQEAEKKKDTDRADYLRGVDKLYRDAEDRKVQAALDGSGSLAAQRDKALADEAAQYTSQQDRIGLSADRAAERKIAASERAGKAIDAEQAKLNTLGTTYDGLAGPRGTPTTTGATPPPAAAVAPAAAATPGGDPVVAALDAIRSAVDAAAAAIVGAEKDTAGAVRSLRNNGNIAG